MPASPSLLRLQPALRHDRIRRGSVRRCCIDLPSICLAPLGTAAMGPSSKFPAMAIHLLALLLFVHLCCLVHVESPSAETSKCLDDPMDIKCLDDHKCTTTWICQVPHRQDRRPEKLRNRVRLPSLKIDKCTSMLSWIRQDRRVNDYFHYDTSKNTSIMSATTHQHLHSNDSNRFEDARFEEFRKRLEYEDSSNCVPFVYCTHTFFFQAESKLQVQVMR
ncbi:hypothetical protein ZWY2020_046788 [Hordeum vulgare]|nr:hypothetical protein ZWY2020_046788 [Hordeum vulgare]